MSSASLARLSERHAEQRKLTPQQARSVRLSLDRADVEGARYGMSAAAISQLRRGETYGALKADERRARQEREARDDRWPPPTTDVLVIGDLFARDHGEDGLADQDRQEQLDAAHECKHGRLPTDRSAPCGCWPQEAGRARRERLKEQADSLRTPTPVRRKIAA